MGRGGWEGSGGEGSSGRGYGWGGGSEEGWVGRKKEELKFHIIIFELSTQWWIQGGFFGFK